MASHPQDLTELPDNALDENIVKARRRYKLLEKLLGPAPVSMLLMTGFIVPLILLSQPLGMIVGLGFAATGAMGLGAARGHMQRLAHDRELDCAVEQEMRKHDPFRFMRSLKERFDKAIHSGTQHDITVKKPLQLKKAPVP